MKSRIVLSGLVLLILFFVPLEGVLKRTAFVNGETVTGRPAEATFVVRWYDVGVHALEGRSGVFSVERGWRGSSEINRVVYDPEKINLEHMEKLLKKSGTYIRTVEEEDNLWM